MMKRTIRDMFRAPLTIFARFKGNIDHRLNFCMGCILFFWGFTTYYLMLEIPYIPLREQSFIYIRDMSWLYEDPSMFWVMCPGDGIITNIENVFIWVFYLWGFMRLLDFFRLVDLKEKQ